MWLRKLEGHWDGAIDLGVCVLGSARRKLWGWLVAVVVEHGGHGSACLRSGLQDLAGLGCIWHFLLHSRWCGCTEGSLRCLS